MKPLSLLSVTLLLVCVLPLQVAAKRVTDDRTGIRYTYVRRTEVGSNTVHVMEMNDYDYQDAAALHAQDGDFFAGRGLRLEDRWKGWMKADSKQLSDIWAEHRESVERDAAYYGADETDKDTCYMQDGNECTVVKGKSAYWRFFGLPLNFSGTKRMEKEGVPFVVTGDGKGTLSFRTDTSEKGVKEFTVTVPPTYDYMETEVTRSKWYEISYVPKPREENVIYDRSYADKDTLEEALDFCAEYADLNEKIVISGILSYERDYYVIRSSALELRFIYGNTDGSDATTYPVLPYPVSKSTTTLPPTTKPSVIPFVPPTTTPAGDITTSFDERSGTLTVSGSGPVRDLYPRCSLEDEWPLYLTGVVEENTTVKHLVIEEGVTEMSNSFNDLKALETVTFPNSLGAIYMSFIDCDSLKRVDLPARIYLSRGGFNDCDQLETIHMEGALFASNEYTLGTFFSNLPSLKEIRFPEGSKIDSVCRHCPNLKKVVFEEDVHLVQGDFCDIENQLLDSFEDCHKDLVVYVPASETAEDGVLYRGSAYLYPHIHFEEQPSESGESLKKEINRSPLLWIVGTGAVLLVAFAILIWWFLGKKRT